MTIENGDIVGAPEKADETKKEKKSLPDRFFDALPKNEQAMMFCVGFLLALVMLVGLLLIVGFIRLTGYIGDAYGPLAVITFLAPTFCISFGLGFVIFSVID